jgi:hypothetical protein
MVATFVSLVSALLAQGTWTWQRQCDSNEWSAICSTNVGCGNDQNAALALVYQDQALSAFSLQARTRC